MMDPSGPTHDELLATARAVRRRALELVLTQEGGYLSQVCSSAEILTTLYLRVMRLGPSVAPAIPSSYDDTPPGFTGAGYNGPKAPDLDRFVFSPSHYALALYTTLVEVGRLAPEALELYGRDGSALEAIGAEHSPGHEVTGGSLAQAISQAAGIALGRKMKGETGRTWVFVSDGELQEGQFWECLQMASWYGLDRLGIVMDRNGFQCDGPMEGVMGVEPVAERLEAFGMDIHEVDGHDPQALCEACGHVGGGRPLFVLAHTRPCQGIPLLERRLPKVHYLRFQDEPEKEALREWLCSNPH
jgi:transketolase